MTKEELNKLSQKVTDGTATKEEQLQLIEELNKELSELLTSFDNT